MNREKKLNVIFFFICVLIGVVIVSLARTAKGDHIYVSQKVLGDYKTSIESEMLEVEKVNKLIYEAEQKLKRYDEYDEDETANEVIKQIESEYELVKGYSGFSDLKGPGVEIILDDGIRELFENEDPNSILVHDLDILIILNELRNGGAEAISINGQRVIAMSEISCSGYTVRINDQFFAGPFVIEAIGDPNMLEAALMIPGGYGDILKFYGLVFNVEKKEEVIIKKYMDEIVPKYVTIVKDGEEK